MYGLRHKRRPRNACAATATTDGTTATAEGATATADGATATADDSNNGASGTVQVMEEPTKKARGRGKRNSTQLRVPPPHGKVQLKPVGTRQFTYVNYNPKEYKYGSQVGVIIRRLYPGMIDVRDDDGRIVEKRAAMSWHDYYCRKDEAGVTYARLVKAEFWNLFSVTRGDSRKANSNLESYLVRRVSDLLYQARLDSVKMHEDCDDNQARSIELTEQEYLSCRPYWCCRDAWAFLSKYWTTKEYKEKRIAAQTSRLNSEDVAQNRGGSRPWGETQQLLEYKFGPEKASTLNTYAVMKSGFKKVDSNGKSAPIPSQRAQKRLNNYNARAQIDVNSKELDVQALYLMEGGMAHGRVPIADGAVDKKTLVAAAKSNRFHSTNTIAYHTVVDENEHLKETNGILNEKNKKLDEMNEILIEENSVNRDMILRFYADFNKEPPADLLNRLENVDARREQITASSHAASNPLDMLSLSIGNDMETDEDDEDYNVMDDDDDCDDDDSCHDDNEISEDLDENEDLHEGDNYDDLDHNGDSEEGSMNGGSEEANRNDHSTAK